MYNFNLVPKEVKSIKTRYRNISGKIPIPEHVELIQKALTYMPNSIHLLPPIVWDKAKNFNVYSGNNKFLDFTSGIFVANCGHNNPKIVKAIKKASNEVLHSFLFYNKYSIELVEKLVNLIPRKHGINKALILSTGTETTETALHMMRDYGLKQSLNKKVIITLQGSFHGEHMGARLMCGKGNKDWISVSDNILSVYHLPYPTSYFESTYEGQQYNSRNFLDDINTLCNENNIVFNDIAGFIVEPYQGFIAGFLPKNYVKQMREFCDKYNSLLSFDEVQSGFGRSGTMFAYELFDVKPDIICCGKGITSGLPLSAVLSRDEIFGDNTCFNSTHTNSPVPSASAIASINYIEENNLVNESYRKGKEIILPKLIDMKLKYPKKIVAIHGNGMAWALSIVKPNTQEFDIDFVDKVVFRCLQKGLLTIKTKCGTIKLGAPLTISDQALIEGLDVIDESIQEIIQEGY